jgi:hypothetical protein
MSTWVRRSSERRVAVPVRLRSVAMTVGWMLNCASRRIVKRLAPKMRVSRI